MSSEERTSEINIVSSLHGRQRRAERQIDKRDLQAAVKYGKCEESKCGRLQYTFADIVYITDSSSTHEITSWAISDTSGFDIAKRPISKQEEVRHFESCERISGDMSSWTSHTVVIVDQSGSMRIADIRGGVSEFVIRSAAVWLTLAIDYIAKHLETKNSSDTDVVSIVAMGREGKILVDRKPHDWVLFNTVIDLLRTQHPSYHGFYLPALDAAEKLLLLNTYGSCALTLFFLSDGKPSDKGLDTTNYSAIMGKRIDALASRFGRRLSVITVGFAGPYENFSVLRHMADRSAQFDSTGLFCAANLNLAALQAAFSSITSSLNRTRSELTAIGGTNQRAVRDVRRCDKNTVGQASYPDDINWFTYREVNRYLYVSKNPRYQRLKPIPAMNTSTCGVALAKQYFGEGAERLVREFREIGPDGEFIGPKTVAKESRFQMDVANTDIRHIEKFHNTFCDTQGRAQRLAHEFNRRLEMLPGFDPETTPKISFLDCSVYMVQDSNVGLISMLVEKQLDPRKYQKWNDNCGAVNGHQFECSEEPFESTRYFYMSEEDSDNDSDPRPFLILRIDTVKDGFLYVIFKAFFRPTLRYLN